MKKKFLSLFNLKSIRVVSLALFLIFVLEDIFNSPNLMFFTLILLIYLTLNYFFVFYEKYKKEKPLKPLTKTFFIAVFLISITASSYLPAFTPESDFYWITGFVFVQVMALLFSSTVFVSFMLFIFLKKLYFRSVKIRKKFFKYLEYKTHIHIPKTKLGIISNIIIYFLIFYSFYIIKYQSLVNETIRLEDEYCIKVNPLIIERKNQYIDFLSTLVPYPNSEESLKSLDKYYSISKKNVNVQKKWLDEYDRFINQWDTKLILVSETLYRLNLRSKIEDMDIRSMQNLVRLYMENDEKKTNDAFQNQMKHDYELKKEIDRYYKLMSEPINLGIIKYFLKLPETKCPQKNYLIPNVDKEIEKLFQEKYDIHNPDDLMINKFGLS